jgi:hypothetical protein
MSKCIHAYTKDGAMPDYVNVYDVDHGSNVRLTVRSSSGRDMAVIHMTPERMERLCLDYLAHKRDKEYADSQGVILPGGGVAHHPV